MYSLFKKEIKAFLGSLIGYLAVLVFLLVTGLFLWVFPGEYNIPENGYATLEGLFTLAPWLYLLLIPAITMRFFADEKRTGTIEVLLTRPISDFKLVLAKFFAGLVLVFFSLFPTLLYFLSVYLLGNPVGSIDVGATWGSFIGLFLLAAIYIAIGIFASSLTDNQIVSFILAMILSFIFYLGFDFIGSSGLTYFLETLASWFSINNHYISLSRGVIDMRDLIYFIGMVLLFLFITSLVLREGKWKLKKTRSNTVTFSVVLIAIFIISSNFLFRIDLTADKRYSLSNESKKVVAGIDNSIEIELYLAGDLEAGLRKIQTEIIEKIAVLNAFAAKPIRIRIFDPYSINNAEKHNDFVNQLTQKGIIPISFKHKTNKGTSTKLIFPGAIIRKGNKEVGVNFLKNNPEYSYEANFNHSIESVEFELVNAVQRLSRSKKSTIAFLEGQDEANTFEVLDISNALSTDFNVERITAQNLKNRFNEIDVLIVADPIKPFAENQKIILDQFIMNGGKVIWLIDPVQVSLDSLANGFQTYSFPRDLNISDQLFKYGFRLNYELLQDVDCIQIPVDISPMGGQPQYELYPWYYSPVLTPNHKHPISRNLNRVLSEFVSSVDTVSVDTDLKRSVILSTSVNGRKVKSPASVSLQNIDNPPARELFNNPFMPVGIIAEGIFSSVYQNRMVENYGYSSTSVINMSKPTKMVVIADGGLITNKVKYSTNPPSIQKLGVEQISGITYGNKEFLMNTILYLNDDQGIMHIRNRTIKLRLLDKVQLREEKAFWQWLNILVPLFLVSLFGVFYNTLRKYRFTR